MQPIQPQAATPWPEFRGPTGDGVTQEKNLPDEWSESQGVAWKTAVPGKAWSSPVVWDSLVWLTNATADGTRLSAVAVAVDSGRIVHDVTVFETAEPQFCHAFNSHASSTPVIEGDRIYLHYGSAGTACLDTASGRIVWARQDLPCDHFRGAGSSPIVHGDLLIVAFDGFDLQYVVALDKRTGTTVWRKDRNIDYGTADGDAKKAYPTASVITSGGREQVVLPSAGATIAYDPKSGEELWRVNHGGMNASARPLFAHGLVYINTAAGGMKLLAVRPDGSGDVTGSHIAWKSSQGTGSRSSQLLLSDRLFLVGDAGTATVLDAVTGKAAWQKRLGGEFSASPILADGRIYASNQTGDTFVLSASDPYDAIATNTLDDGCMASPAVFDGAIYLRTKTHLYKIGPR
ncbi:MAG: PQQ-binding-like beta-propeller repeat protein [Planctomycetes bacterium]|nr:PQQ-binding-like beta-propeller repeat protein [Planctomycetota bacterium]